MAERHRGPDIIIQAQTGVDHGGIHHTRIVVPQHIKPVKLLMSYERSEISLDKQTLEPKICSVLQRREKANSDSGLILMMCLKQAVE